MEKGLHLCSAMHHARQLLSDTKTPRFFLLSISGWEWFFSLFFLTFWEAFLPTAVSDLELRAPGSSLSDQSLVWGCICRGMQNCFHLKIFL